jgi:hypothetical protein
MENKIARPNTAIHLSRHREAVFFVHALCGQVMASVRQIRRLADGLTKLSHQRPVD